jgi:2-dehydro-3-deoxygluconokinase
MGLYFLEHGAMQRPSRIIYDRFHSAFSNISAGEIDWDNVFKDTAWFHWTGITPAISQGAADVCAEALVAARKNNVVVSGDINYRRNLWQYGKDPKEVMPSLIEYTDYIVAGIEDIQNCTQVTGDTFVEASEAIMRQFRSLKAVATTTRATLSASHNKISGILYAGKKLHQSREYDLPAIVDRIGAGDAYMAGLIYGWMNNKSHSDTVEFATAASAWKHAVEGDSNIATVDDINALIHGETGRLLR